MKSHAITGGGGIRLHVIEAGNPRGKAFLFLHGFSQSAFSWVRQLSSPLAETFRLIAMDLRGHGLSEKPRDGYANSRLWADDVHALIGTLDLDHPILCGWSYGPLVILDYLRHYGEGGIGGVNFVGGITKLGSDEAVSVLTPEFLGLIPGFFSTDAEESVRSLTSLLHLCFAADPSPEDLYRMVGYSVSVPPYVRQALFSRAFDNDDLLPRLRAPVLITHGSHDAIVRPAVIERQMSFIPGAKVERMATGHACFWDDAAGYNASLREFARAL